MLQKETAQLDAWGVRDLWPALLRDPVVRFALVVHLGLALLYLTALPDVEWWASVVGGGAVPLMMLMAVVAIGWGLRQVEGVRQRRFWQMWGGGMLIWLLIQLAYVFPPPGDEQLVALGIESGIAAFYVIVLAALGLHPQRPVERAGDRIERRFEAVSVSIFVFTLVMYFAVLTSTLQPELYDAWTPSLNLYVVLDLAIFARLVYLRWHMKRIQSVRWAAIYTGLATVAFLWTITDTLTVLSTMDAVPVSTWGQGAVDWLWYLPHSALIVTARMRDLPFPAPAARVRPAFVRRATRPWSGVLVSCAITLPLLHLALGMGGVVDPALEDSRDLLIFAAVFLLGGIALRYQWFLEGENRRLQMDERARDQERMEAQIAAAKLDERTAAEAEQRRAKEYFLSIYENATVGIFLCTKAGRILDANPATVLMLGYESSEQLLAADPETIYAAATGHRQLLEALSQNGTFQDVEVEWQRRDGSRIVVLLNGREAELDGEDVFVIIAQDITLRRGLEEQVRQTQKMDAVGRLAGGMAHDFNNLLTVISGHAEILVEEADDPAAQADIEEILAASRRATALTSQLLTFSRRQITAPRVTDINDLIEGLKSMMARLIGETVEVVTDFGANLPPVEVDPGQLEQVLVNLVVNARDAMQRGGTITLSTEARNLDAENVFGLDEGEHVVISVRDEGVGMDESTRTRVFEPFFTTKEVGKGTGLGLSTAYAIVERAGGSIRVDSTLGQGSSFHVAFPRSSGGGPVRER